MTKTDYAQENESIIQAQNQTIQQYEVMVTRLLANEEIIDGKLKSMVIQIKEACDRIREMRKTK